MSKMEDDAKGVIKAAREIEQMPFEVASQSKEAMYVVLMTFLQRADRFAKCVLILSDALDQYYDMSKLDEVNRACQKCNELFE